MFDFSSYSTKSEYYYNSNNLVVGKMKNETVCVLIEELVRRIKSKTYSYLVNDNSERKKAKSVNKDFCCNNMS